MGTTSPAGRGGMETPSAAAAGERIAREALRRMTPGQRLAVAASIYPTGSPG